MTTKGLFISFEGLEAAGKGTQTNMLKDYIYRKTHNVLLTEGFGGSPIGNRIRQAILVDNIQVSMKTLQHLFIAMTYEIQRDILPKLNDGTHVIIDRFIDSKVAYTTNGIKPHEIYASHQDLFPKLIPDITFLLDVPPEESRKRVLARSYRFNNMYDYQSLEFLIDIRNKFLNAAEQYPKRIKVIDGTISKDKIHQTILTHLRELGLK